MERSCFKCAGPDGRPRTSHAMASGWYETSRPSRTVYLCDGCYASDARKGKRWGVVENLEDKATAGWVNIKPGAPEFGRRKPDFIPVAA